MAGEYNRFAKNARASLQSLGSPVHQAEALLQDTDPENVKMLQQSLADPRHRGKMQQQVLGDELKRIQGIQTQQIQQAAQMLPQKLNQELSPAKTGEPWPSPEAMMIRLMLQMRRRYPGMPPEAANNYDPENRMSQMIRNQSQTSNNIQRLRSGQTVYFPDGDGRGVGGRTIP